MAISLNDGFTRYLCGLPGCREKNPAYIKKQILMWLQLPVLFIMMRVRGVERILRAYATVEGAGVKLHRAFGNYEVPQFDPFLMLDDFRAGRPGRLSRRLSLAPAPGYRNGHLHARRHG